MFANTPNPPYYAVIFTALLKKPGREYVSLANNIIFLADNQPGFLGIESIANEDGYGITISYWENEDSISKWKDNIEHKFAQKMGKETFYKKYSIRVSKVERITQFGF